MSLQNSSQPIIRQGWIRALLLLIIYVGLSACAGLFVSSLYEWIFISFLIAALLVFAFRRFVDKQSFESLGVELPKLYPHAFTGMAIGAFLVSAGTLLIYFLGGIEWMDIVVNPNSLIIDLVILLMVAVAEELVFRGYVLQNLRTSMNKWLALSLSALFFTLVHVSNAGIIPVAIINTFLGGLLLGLTVTRTRSLWIAVFFHLTWNYLQGPVIGYKVSGIEFKPLLIAQGGGNNYISGGDYGFEGSLIATAMLLFALVVWMLLYQRNRQTAKETD